MSATTQHIWHESRHQWPYWAPSRHHFGSRPSASTLARHRRRRGDQAPQNGQRAPELYLVMSGRASGSRFTATRWCADLERACGSRIRRPIVSPSRN